MSLAYEEHHGPAEIARRIQDIARRIESDYGKGPVVLAAVLKGAAVFAADLGRALEIPARLEYIDVLRGSEGEDEIVDFNFVTSFKAKDMDVLILKDVIRSGVIENYLLDHLREQGPRSIRFACLVDRPQERKSALTADYVLFPSGEGILIGYGMEYEAQGGTFPFIGRVLPGTGAPIPETPTGKGRRRQ